MKYAKPGTLFMDGGEEMCNSVEGTTLADSSYIEWKDSAEYADVVSYYRGLMEIRKAFSPLAKSQTIKILKLMCLQVQKTTSGILWLY